MTRAARNHAIRFYVAVALGVAAVSAAVFVRKAPREAVRHPLADAPDAAAVVEWCGEGLEAIAGGGCFAGARPTAGAPARPTTLLVYLHGRYAPEGAAEELERQSRVARLGTARGYAVLALRGLQGQCTDPQLATWWCWPSNERNAGDGAEFVARWSTALAEAGRRAQPTRRVLLGFSNGAYFAALIASRALAPFDAVAIAHGGPVQPMRPVGAMPPVLLVDADEDPSGPEMSRLDADLARESWPHAVVVREGGHALPEWDIDMALTFFDRTRTEKLPLSPPLGRAVRRVVEEAGTEAGVETEPVVVTPDAAVAETDAAVPDPEETVPPPPKGEQGQEQGQGQGLE